MNTLNFIYDVVRQVTVKQLKILGTINHKILDLFLLSVEGISIVASFDKILVPSTQEWFQKSIVSPFPKDQHVVESSHPEAFIMPFQRADDRSY